MGARTTQAGRALLVATGRPPRGAIALPGRARPSAAGSAGARGASARWRHNTSMPSAAALAAAACPGRAVAPRVRAWGGGGDGAGAMSHRAPRFHFLAWKKKIKYPFGLTQRNPWVICEGTCGWERSHMRYWGAARHVGGEAPYSNSLLPASNASLRENRSATRGHRGAGPRLTSGPCECRDGLGDAREDHGADPQRRAPGSRSASLRRAAGRRRAAPPPLSGRGSAELPQPRRHPRKMAAAASEQVRARGAARDGRAGGAAFAVRVRAALGTGIPAANSCPPPNMWGRREADCAPRSWQQPECRAWAWGGGEGESGRRECVWEARCSDVLARSRGGAARVGMSRCWVTERPVIRAV